MHIFIAAGFLDSSKFG